MTKNKLAVFLTALVSVFTLSSCFNSDNSSNWDWACFATVHEYMGSVYLAGDDGVTYYPSNPDYVRLTTSDGSVKYAERVYVYMKFLNETETPSSSKSKNVTIVGASGIPVKALCNQPDTIKTTRPLGSLRGIGGTKGYVTLDFTIYYNGGNIAFDLYPEKVEDDLLTLRLKQTYGNDAYGYNEQAYLLSFRMPNFYDLQTLVKDMKLGALTPVQDSIYVKVIGTGYNDSDLTVGEPYSKVRLSIND